MSATCRNCAHYDLERFRMANGKLRVLTDKVAACNFDMQRLVRKFPASVRPAYSVPRSASAYGIAPTKMSPDEGVGCPQWTATPAGAIMTATPDAAEIAEIAGKLTAAQISSIDAGIAALEEEASAELSKAQRYPWGSATAAKHFARASAIDDECKLLAEVRAALQPEAATHTDGSTR